MKSMIVPLIISLAITFGVMATLNYETKQKQDVLAARVCEFIQNDAQTGNIRGSLDQSVHLMRMTPEGGQARASFKDDNGNYGALTSAPSQLQFREVPCSVVGLGSHEIIYSFPETSLLDFRFLYLFGAVLLGYLTLKSITKLLVSRAVQSISTSLSEGLAQELGVSQSTKKSESKILRVMNFALSKFVAETRPQIEQLKIATLEKIKLEADALRAKEFAKAVRQADHDLRGPLSSLKVIASDLTDQPDKVRRLLEVIKSVDDVSSDLSNHEGIMSSMDALGTDAIEIIVAEVLEEKSPVWNSLIKVSFDFDHNQLATVSIHRSHFRRTVANILQNAAEAMKGDGSIDIKVSRSGANAILAISDSGAGMPQETVKRIFEPGFTGKRGGSGLGLKHAKACVERWGGAIKVESREGQGTTVTLILPMVESLYRLVGPHYLRKRALLAAMDDQPEFLTILPAFQGRSELVFHPRQFVPWFRGHADPDQHIISVDYHLNDTFDGIDILREIPRTFERVLTTDDYLNLKAQAAAAELGFAILAKPLLRLVL